MCTIRRCSDVQPAAASQCPWRQRPRRHPRPSPRVLEQ